MISNKSLVEILFALLFPLSTFANESEKGLRGLVQ